MGERSIIISFFLHEQADHRRGRLKKSHSRRLATKPGPFGRDLEGGVIFHDIRRTVKTSMFNSGVDKVHRDIILGLGLTGMDVHYMAPSEDDLHRVMAKYTECLDGN